MIMPSSNKTFQTEKIAKLSRIKLDIYDILDNDCGK